MATVVLHCYYTGEESAVRGFVAEMYASGVRQAVLGEEGCVQYDYFYPAQGAGCALLLEQWRDEQAFSQHVSGTVMTQIRALKAKYGVETRIERYQPQN